MYEEINENLILSSSKFIKQREYWKQKLAGDIGETKLWTDSTRSAPDPGGETLEIPIPFDLSTRLIHLGNRNDIALYIILAAVLKILVYRCTANETVIIISPIYTANETEETINDFLFIRDTVKGEMTFKELLNEIRQSLLEAFENQDYPFGKLTDFFRETSIGSPLPLISDIICCLGNIHHEVSLTGTDANLLFFFLREGDNLRGQLQYRRGIFDQSDAKQISRQFVHLLTDCIRHPNQEIHRMSFLSDREKERLVYEFNETTFSCPAAQTIDQLFQQQVEKTPFYTAAVENAVHLSYRELNKKADRLAHILNEKGVEAGGIVGIAGRRSLELLGGILAVLKAGGAYVPIEPQIPTKRVVDILEDCGAAILLTDQTILHRHSREDLQAAHQTAPGHLEILLLDMADESPGSEPAHNPEHRHTPGDLAYIIYTSGSTGKSKGVMIQHRALVNYICWAAANYIKNERIHFPLYTSIAFDLTVTSLFTPLITGNSIYIYGEEDKGDLIRQILEENKVGVIKLTPTHLKLLLNYGETLPRLKRLIVGGEELKTGLARDIFDRFQGDVEIYNEYGPTEATVGCMLYQYNPQTDITPTVPIGKPAGNIYIYILDGYKNPVPFRVAGEIYISGAAVAVGYLNNPGLTKEKFIPNPFTAGSMYQSGDLARWREDGNIEFLGRNDHQVKIRGYRIEPGEIESQLLAHEDIRDAVVIALDKETKNVLNNQNREKETYLCAYIVSRNQLDTPGLIEYLSGSLPGYMIPSYFVFLDRIPLTPNGKIHHRGLPLPRVEKDAEHIAPVTAAEKKLAKIWSEVLEVDEEVIGINSNFFQLGGHSLKVMKLAAQIYKEFNQKIPLTKIFEGPTLKSLVQYISNAGETIFISIEPVEKREYYPLSAAQHRLYNLYRLSPQSTAYNVAIIRVLAGKLDRTRFEETFKQLIQRHESLRTCFDEINNEPVQRVYAEMEPEVQYQDICESGQPEKEIFQDFKKPFVLEKAPLARMKLFKSNQTSHILMLEMHHIITDGLSMEVFVKEAAVLYNGGEPEPLKLQYKDFSQWQNKAREIGILKKQEEYWSAQFADGLPILNLPFDFKRPMVQVFEGERIAFEIDAGQTAAIKNLGLEEDATLSMVLMAVYYILLSKLSGQEDIVVGQYISGRSHIDLGNIIGLFINILPIRCYLSEDKTFRQFLRDTKSKTLEGFENQDIPLNDLMELILTQKNVKQNFLFNASFIFQSQDRRALKIEGLRIKPYKYDTQSYTTKVDLLFDGSERGKTIIFTVEYSSQLFRRQTIEYVVTSYKNILSVLTKNPETQLSEIQMSHGVKPQTVSYAFQDDLENE